MTQSCARESPDWILGKKFFTKRVDKQCKRLPREVNTFLVFKKHFNCALEHIWFKFWTALSESGVGLGTLVGPF